MKCFPKGLPKKKEKPQNHRELNECSLLYEVGLSCGLSRGALMIWKEVSEFGRNDHLQWAEVPWSSVSHWRPLAASRFSDFGEHATGQHGRLESCDPQMGKVSAYKSQRSFSRFQSCAWRLALLSPRLAAELDFELLLGMLLGSPAGVALGTLWP